MSRYLGHKYVAFGNSGDYTRSALTIGELPTTEMRMAAINEARKILNMNIQFGVTLGLSNKLSRSDIKSDATGFLSLRGCELPLTIFN